MPARERISSKIELAGKIIILAMAIPILTVLIETIIKLNSELMKDPVKRGVKMKQRMQFIPIMILVFFFLSFSGVQAADETKDTSNPLSPQELVDAQLKTFDMTELKQFWEDITNKYGGFLPESQKGSLYDFVKGEKEIFV